MRNFEITTNMQHMEDGDYLIDFVVNGDIVGIDLVHEDILKDPARLKEYMLSVFTKGVDRGE